MTNVVDINKAKRQTSNKMNEPVDDMCIDIMQEWIPKYISNKVPNELLVIDYQQSWAIKDTRVGLTCNIMYLLANGKRKKFNVFKKELTKDLGMLDRVSSHTFSSLIKILLQKKIPFIEVMNRILKELASVDSFMFFSPHGHFTLPLTEKNEKGEEEIKGIFYTLEADDGSCVLCKMILTETTNES